MSTDNNHKTPVVGTADTAHDMTTSSPQEASTIPAPLTTTNVEHRSTSQSQMATEEESHSKSAGPVRTDTNTAMMQAQSPPSPPPAMPSNPITRTKSSAIGPSVDQPAPPAKDEETAGPSLQITLLLTNGARHPFKLDSKYLAKRNVTVQDNDPYNLSVYKLKELILREWREEWELKPTNPSYIRLISFGRLLDDKAALKDQRFNSEAQNVVHMTIKPQDFVDEDEGGKGVKASYSNQRDSGSGSSPGCRCVIM